MTESNIKSAEEKDLPESESIDAAEYQKKVLENYRWNLPIGIAHGVTHYAAMGFYYQATVMSKFIFDLSGSSALVGVFNSLGSLAHQLPQLFGSALVEHLPRKKRMLIIFGLIARIPWLLLSLVVLAVPKPLALPLSIFLYTAAMSFYGLYILVWTDLMAKVVPLEFRGNYFGVRNFLSSLATAGAGIVAGKIIQAYLYPWGYTISFFVAFVIHFIDLWILSRTIEEPSIKVSKKASIGEKIRDIPKYLKMDPNFARYCIARTLASFIVVGFPFYILFAQEKLALDARSAAAAVGTFTFAQVFSRAIGNLIWGKVSQRSGYKAPLEMACLIIGAVSVVSAYINSYTGFIVALLVAGVGSAGFFLSSLNILMEFGKSHQRTTYIGIANAVVGLGGFIAPFLAGVVAQQYSYPHVFWMIGIISIITYLLFRFYVKDPRQIEAYRD